MQAASKLLGNGVSGVASRCVQLITDWLLFLRVLRANLVGLSQARSPTSPQPRLGQQRHDLARRDGLGTFGQRSAIAYGDDVVVITLEPASRDADPGREVMQLLVRPVADHVRPEVPVARPYRRVDVDGQG